MMRGEDNRAFVCSPQLLLCRTVVEGQDLRNLRDLPPQSPAGLQSLTCMCACLHVMTSV